VTLSPRQTSVLVFVRDFVATHGYSPSIREIAAWLGISLHGAEKHIEALERKDAIARTRGVARSIRVNGGVDA